MDNRRKSKGAAYAALKAEWDKKLKDSGFVDLENPENPDAPIQPEIITLVKSDGSYELGQQILREYSFERYMDRKIFELHTDGHSEREIENWLKVALPPPPPVGLDEQDVYKWLKFHLIKPLTQPRIHQIIKKIRIEFLTGENPACVTQKRSVSKVNSGH